MKYRYIIDVLQNKKGKWFWRIKAKNSKILAHSEAYSRKKECMKMALRVYFDLTFSVMKAEETQSYVPYR